MTLGQVITFEFTNKPCVLGKQACGVFSYKCYNTLIVSDVLHRISPL